MSKKKLLRTGVCCPNISSNSAEELEIGDTSITVDHDRDLNLPMC